MQVNALRRRIEKEQAGYKEGMKPQRSKQKTGFFFAFATALLMGCETNVTVNVNEATAAPTVFPTATAMAAVNRIEPSSATVTVGGTQTFTAYLIDRTGKTVDSSKSSSVAWTVSPTNLGRFGATVSTRGLFTAEKAGTGVVTAQLPSFYGGAQATASLIVSAVAASPTVKPSTSPSPSASPSSSPSPTPTPIVNSSVELVIQF